METSLAYQGRRVAIDAQQLFAALSARAMATQEDAIFYRHDDLVSLLEKAGVESDPHGRWYRARAVRVRTNRQAIAELRLGRPLLAGTSIQNAWLEPAVARSGIIPARPADSHVVGGKTLGVLGYDATADAFIILLGWPSWGMNGFGLLPAAQAFGGSIHDAHSIEAYEFSPAAAAPDRPAGSTGAGRAT